MDILYPITLFAVIGAVAIAIAVLAVAPMERRWLSGTLGAALGARLAAVAMFAAFPATRMFHDDANGYEYFGRQLALYWHHLRPPVTIVTAMGQNYGWTYVCGYIYYVFGDFPALAAAFNALLGTMVVFLVYVLARQFFHAFVARRAALLTAFIPSMVLWSSVAIKDTSMALLILVALLSCVSIKRRFNPVAAIMLCLSLVAMQPIRFYMIYFLGFAIVISLFLERGMGLVSGVYKQIVIVGMAAGLLVMVGMTGKVKSGLEAFDLANVSHFRQGMAETAASGFDADVDVSTPGRAIAFLPLGVTMLVLGPFPWQFTSLRALFAAPETLYWWLLFPATMRGLWWMLRKRFASTSPLLLFTMTLTCGYSLMHGNIGSAFRQRAQIFIVLFIFTALGTYRKKCINARLDPDLLLVDGEPPRATIPTTASPLRAT